MPALCRTPGATWWPATDDGGRWPTAPTPWSRHGPSSPRSHLSPPFLLAHLQHSSSSPAAVAALPCHCRRRRARFRRSAHAKAPQARARAPPHRGAPHASPFHQGNGSGCSTWLAGVGQRLAEALAAPATLLRPSFLPFFSSFLAHLFRLDAADLIRRSSCLAVAGAAGSAPSRATTPPCTLASSLPSSPGRGACTAESALPRGAPRRRSRRRGPHWRRGIAGQPSPLLGCG